MATTEEHLAVLRNVVHHRCASESCTGEPNCWCDDCKAARAGAGMWETPAIDKANTLRAERDEARAGFEEAAAELASSVNKLDNAHAALSQATAREAVLRSVVEQLRCKVTDNICGTDTWNVGKSCACSSCTAWLSLREPSPAAEALLRVVEAARGITGALPSEVDLLDALAAYDAALKGGGK